MLRDNRAFLVVYCISLRAWKRGQEKREELYARRAKNKVIRNGGIPVPTWRVEENWYQ